ncbi:MAG TPA: hypothetical protein VE775_02890 [Pyrinomonadaceae bacterium]|nr:hypothetical protein [Pyrinomonadaceae bacterium]
MTPDEAEKTLVTPRFDETEAQEARPVEPLADVRRRSWPSLGRHFRAPHARPWALALMAACLLAIGAIGATVFMRGRATSAPPAPVEQTAAQVPANPTTTQPNRAADNAPARARTERREPDAPRAASQPVVRPPVEYVSADDEDGARRGGETRARGEEKREHKKEQRKHKERDGEDEDAGFSAPRAKKDKQRANGARLVDVIH